MQKGTGQLYGVSIGSLDNEERSTVDETRAGMAHGHKLVCPSDLCVLYIVWY